MCDCTGLKKARFIDPENVEVEDRQHLLERMRDIQLEILTLVRTLVDFAQQEIQRGHDNA